MQRLISPAKVNFGLKVYPKIKNFLLHNLETLIVPYYKLFDVITLTKKPSFPSVLEITSKFDVDGLSTPDNLILKAINNFNARFNANHHFTINLQKNIPVGSGLGGGSSNGAEILKYLCSLHGWPLEVVQDLAFELSNDMPFFLKNQICYVSDYGRQVEVVPFEYLGKWRVVLNSDINCNTSAVYQQFDKIGGGETPNYPELWNCIADGEYDHFSEQLRNNLEAACFSLYPELLERKKLLAKKGTTVLLSGSGSSFLVFDNLL